MTAQWTFYVCEVTTGRLVAELPLVNVSAQRHLKRGTFSADLPLGLAGDPDATEFDRFHAQQAQLRELLQTTTPAKYSIVVDRDGTPLGEWIIWQRTRGNPTKLQGVEFGSLLGFQPMPGVTFSGVDQFTIAQYMAQVGFGPANVAGSSAVSIPTSLSGVLRDRTYEAGDSTMVLQRLDELSDVDDGFDWTVEVQWVSIGGVRYISRTLQLSYPRAGMNRSIILDQPGPGGSGGAILGFDLQEDGTNLANRAMAFGSGDGLKKVIGVATNSALITAGYPAMTAVATYSSVSVPATLNGHARSLLSLSQSPELPPTVTIRGDVEPEIGSYTLGDIVRVQVDPRPEYPDGYNEDVRIQGWTFTPGVGPEIVPLEITSILDMPGSDVAPS